MRNFFQRSRSSADQSSHRRRFREVHEQGKSAFQAGDLPGAETYFEEAVSISRSMVSVAPRDEELGALGTSLTNLAEVLRRMGANPETEPLLVEAAATFRRMAVEDPDEALSALTQTLLALAKVYRGLQFYADFSQPPMTEISSMREYRKEQQAAGVWRGAPMGVSSPEWVARGESPLIEAIGLLRKLVRSNPQMAEPRLALALNLLGELYLETDRTWDGLEPLSEAETLYRKLLARDPTFYQPLLTDTLSLLARASVGTPPSSGRMAALEELLPELRRAAHITDYERENGVTMAQAAARRRLSDTLKELAGLYKETGQTEKSSELWNGELGDLYTESLIIRRG